jgi:ATP-dependent exoDNAse (exonuclease V) beta subunit
MALITYTASAGSGKTYALTREYLRMLLAQPEKTAAYRQLLAITFTNKAADEMKIRILERLNKIAAGSDTAAGTEFCAPLSLSPETLQKRALSLRTAILHDYSRFSVLTIDAFFQKIIRSLLREMGLLPGFALELDSERLLDEAIDTLWQEAATNPPLRERLTDLTIQRISDGKSWNAREQLKKIGREVFEESFRSLGTRFLEKIGDAGFLKNYEQALQAIITDFKSTLHRLGKEALQLLAEHNLKTTDFKYKTSSFANYFNKITNPAADKDYLPGVRVREALDNEKKWLTDDDGKNAIIRTAVYPALNPLLAQAVAHCEARMMDYRTAREILKNLYGMSLLADLANKVTAVANEQNKLFINDTLYLLRSLVGHHDTPFVYEKAGIYYDSFLLDEFQDTSNMQWESLRPLLLNGLSEGGNVLAVGDVKQSIYRWRNGDWRILAQGIYDYFTAFDSQRRSLDTNWRSREVIVDTNNRLFARLPALLQQKLNEQMDAAAKIPQENGRENLRNFIPGAYEEALQKVSPTKTGSGGYVRIEHIVTEETEDIKAKEKVLQQLPLLIAALQDRGYRPSDIAVLVRYGYEGQEVADALLQYKQTSEDTTHSFDILSQDSLFLSHAPVIRFIVAVLHRVVAADDAISQAVAEHYLKRFHPGMKLGADLLTKLLSMPLPEAIEEIIAHFYLGENAGNWAFLQEFQEVALDYANKERNDIYSFLEHWKDIGSSRYTLSMTENNKAIRVLTIHKSKGLQFPVVIIPFCNWSIEPKTGSLIWVKADREPFSGPEYLPLSYTGSLAETHFDADYWSERAQTCIDNLNLLYVAFTRAEDELYVFVPQPGKKTAGTFAQLLPEALQTELFEAGEQAPPSAKKAEENTPDILWLDKYVSQPYAGALQMKYEDEHSSDIDAASMRDYGILMHRAFSYIKTANDVEAAVGRLVEEGFLKNDDAQREVLHNLLTKALNQQGVAEWFDGSWQLLTETDLLLPAGRGEKTAQLRPDRVMYRKNEVVVIDYKFGKNESQQHIRQVENYISAIEKMGYDNVKGYCWYISLGLILLVKINN